MAKNEKNLHGYLVFYDDNAAKGAEHLAYVLTFDEAESLFRAARNTGKVKFEDRIGRNFTLIGNLDGTFEIQARSNSWF